MIGFSQVIAVLAVMSVTGQRYGISTPGEIPSDGVEQIAAVVFALVITFGGAGYAALHGDHQRPIARTLLAYVLYLTTTGMGILLAWLTENGWFAVLPVFGLGLLLAAVLPKGSSSRTLMRISVPTLIGGFLVALRNLADAYWSIPTPDWTLTMAASFLIAMWAINKAETSAGRSPQPVDPGPGPLRV